LTTYPRARRRAATASPPSRNANPFATCWTRTGAIPFLFPDGHGTTQLLGRLAEQRWRGAIIGPHGSGKSTLLETLKPAMQAVGLVAHAFTLRDRRHRLPASFLEALPGRSAIVIIDGYEQLGWRDRFKLHRKCRRAAIGLLVTSHSPARLPILVRLAPDERLIQKLVADLTTGVSTRITPADVAASHARHGCNVREVFFDLYDRHERLRRAERTLTAAGA
jgi:hypothetical protein